ncbi:hypothetical protein CURTO8I2_120058 [Curtobacterium sp. 8I-2]|nr:hypothetical protein CURTO8I2_120058 [Curtobacterium sp. 8I-2]
MFPGAGGFGPGPGPRGGAGAAGCAREVCVRVVTTCRAEVAGGSRTIGWGARERRFVTTRRRLGGAS